MGWSESFVLMNIDDVVYWSNSILGQFQYSRAEKFTTLESSSQRAKSLHIRCLLCSALFVGMAPVRP
jgi:hypothetical protein